MIQQRSKYHDHIAAAKAIGYLLIMMGAIILVPLLLLAFPKYRGEMDHLGWFLFPGIISIFAGYLIKFLTRGIKIKELKKFYGSVIVLELWLVALNVGMIPFLMSGKFTFTQAVFETMSGLTTTGFTIFPWEYRDSMQMLILYRSLLQLVGGVGLVLVLTTILSNAYGMQIFSAEGHIDRLAPSPLHSARTILQIYVGFILGGTVAFSVLGMSWFDAFNYAISAVATGGFAPHEESIAYYYGVVSWQRAYAIDHVAMLLMLLGATNFMASMYFLQGKFRRFFYHYEVRATIIMIAIATPIVSADFIVNHETPSVLQDVESALFLVISSLTTTGLTTFNDDLTHPSFGMIPMFALMLIGGHSDSTAGGMKVSRIALAFKSVAWDIKSNLSSSRNITSHQLWKFGNKVTISDKERAQNFSYIFLYFIIIFIGGLALMLCGYDFRTAMVDFASCLGTIGISAGTVRRTSSNPTLWIIIVGMIMARLELYIFIFAGARGKMDITEYRNHTGALKKEAKRREKQRREIRQARRTDNLDKIAHAAHPRPDEHAGEPQERSDIRNTIHEERRRQP